LENVALKEQVESVSSTQGDSETYLDQIEALKQELGEKDEEIEKIIEQVEALLS
jgi:ABC-type transporter Mla subunit MlaD